VREHQLLGEQGLEASKDSGFSEPWVHSKAWLGGRSCPGCWLGWARTAPCSPSSGMQLSAWSVVTHLNGSHLA